MKASAFSFKKQLSNKRFTMPFSFLLAFLFWLVLTITQKPNMDRTLSNLTVNINMENTLADSNKMSIIGDISSQKFTVLVRGSKRTVGPLTNDNINLYASVAAVDEPGEYNLEVAATRNNTNGDFEIVSITPSTVNVVFDYIETKEFTITASAVGATAEEGLVAESGVVSGTESDTITIKGPRAVINRIETVVATAEVNKTLSVSESFEANIVLLDETGAEISTENLTLSTQKVMVTVPISKSKTVPVRVEFSNLPDGFDRNVLPVSVDHPTVTVIGTPAAVDKTTEVVLSAIDITAVSTTSNSFDVAPKLPEGVRLLDSIDHFTVTIDTSGFIEKTINVTSVRFTDLASNLSTSEGTEEIRNVKICGPRKIINSLNPEDAYAKVSLTDKMAGQHTVNAAICFNNQTRVWAVGTYKTTVTVK